MKFNFFGWVREKVREAVMSGFGNALNELDTPDNPELEAVRERLGTGQKALAPVEEPARVKKTK